MTTTQESRIRNHGLNLLKIFPSATETDPIQLCKKLRRLEATAASLALRLCNGPEFPGGPEQVDTLFDNVLKRVNTLLGNVHVYQPKTGAKCSCKRGLQRDNCSACEGTGFAIDFARIRSRQALVPVFVNRDPRGHALKIRDEYVREQRLTITTDWGGYGIIAPEIGRED